VQTETLATLYSSKTDDELIALAADPNSLTEAAQSVLASELLRRNVALTKASPTEIKTEQSHQRIAKLLQAAGALVLNLAIAIVGTAVIESPIWRVWSQMERTRSVSRIEAREWFLGLTIAALLGFFVGRRRATTAIWVWTVPVAFFGLGALMYITGPHSVLANDGGFASHFFAPKCFDNTCGWRDFFTFTVPAARTLVYSVGTKVSLHLQSRKTKSDVPASVL